MLAAAEHAALQAEVDGGLAHCVHALHGIDLPWRSAAAWGADAALPVRNLQRAPLSLGPYAQLRPGAPASSCAPTDCCPSQRLWGAKVSSRRKPHPQPAAQGIRLPHKFSGFSHLTWSQSPQISCFMNVFPGWS